MSFAGPTIYDTEQVAIKCAIRLDDLAHISYFSSSGIRFGID